MNGIINTKYMPKARPTVKTNSDINTLYQLVFDRPTRHDIAEAIGQINTPNNILSLRQQGWDIETVRIPFTNHFGEATWRGRYLLSQEHIEYAIDNHFSDVDCACYQAN